MTADRMPGEKTLEVEEAGMDVEAGRVSCCRGDEADRPEPPTTVAADTTAAAAV